MNNNRNRVIQYNGTPGFGTEPSALIFDHLHKCAGTTFRHQLLSRFDTFYDFSFLEAWVRDRAAIRQCNSRCLAIAGHTAMGAHELLPPNYNAYYITVLRDPYNRALSEHRFLRDWYYPAPPLSEYIHQMQPNYLVNRIGNGSIELAIERLHSFYHLFGLAERFDEFLAMLSAITNIDFSIYHSKNRSNACDERPAASLREEFAELNTLDMELYAVATDLFNSRFQSKGPRACQTQLTSATVPDEHIATSTGITRLIDHRRFAEAASQVDAIEPRDNAEHLQLLLSSSMLHLAAGQHMEAATRAHTATQINMERALTEASILKEANPAEARKVLHNALMHFQPIESEQPDSHLNRFREEAQQALAQLDNTPNLWVRSSDSCLHCRWVIMKLSALAMATAAKPVRVALYGNGRHTEWLIALLRQLPLSISITLILDDNIEASATAPQQCATPLCRPDAGLTGTFDVIILSSDSAEYLLRQRCSEVFPPSTNIYSLYQGFPYPPGPYPKADPNLPRISLITVPSGKNNAILTSWQAQIQAQCYPNLEHISVVNASRSTPADEILPWAREIPIPDSACYADAINAALAAATGEWVCLADPEDSLEPGALHALAHQLPFTDVILGATRLTRNGVCIDVITPRTTSPEAILEWWHYDVVPPSGNSIFFRHQALISAMTGIPEDLTGAGLRYELLLRTGKNTGTIATTNTILASTKSIMPVIEAAQGSSLSRRHDARLSPAARINHRQLDLLLTGSSEDFISAQQTVSRPSSNDLPPISVVTPSYNARAFLARACYSVSMQCYPQVEHIVIDGDSNDGTQEIFRHFPLRSISEPDRGMYDAINKGIKLAAHEYILVLSSDDFLEPGALQAIGTFLRSHPNTPFLAGGLRVINPEKRVSYNSASSYRLANLLRWWRPNAYPYNTLAYVFTRKHWSKVGGFDANLRVAADADFVLKSRQHADFAGLQCIFGTWAMRLECLTMQTRISCGLDELRKVVARHTDALGPAERKQFLEEQEAAICAY